MFSPGTKERTNSGHRHWGGNEGQDCRATLAVSDRGTGKFVAGLARLLLLTMSAGILAMPMLAAAPAFADDVTDSSRCIPYYTWDGEGDYDHFGYYVSGAGDVDADGFDDVIVGAYTNDAAGDSAGRAYVYSGQTGVLLYTFTGEAAGDFFGWQVSRAGDVNNDGYDDVIVGAPRNAAVGYNAGRAYVYSGEDGALLYVFDAETERDHFGGSVSGAGDVNDDGFDDVIVGAFTAYGDDDRVGRAYVFSGYDGDTLHVFVGEAFSDQLGWAVSGAGDVDEDGYADIVVGARFCDMTAIDAGRVYVYSGMTGDVLHVFDGEGEGDHFGTSVADAGDVDNDGFPDLIIGAPHNDGAATDAGRVYVYSGRDGSLLYEFSGEEVEDRLGWDAAGAGDINHDGYADLVTGAMLHDGTALDAGRAYVYSGKDGSLLWAFDGEASHDLFGLRMDGAGDINNDGTPDLIVGASGHCAGGYKAGRAYVFACFPTVGAIAGRVAANCPAANTGLLGVTIDAFEKSTGDLAGTGVTDQDGNYQIDSLSPGDYTVTIVKPLGYSIEIEEVEVTVVGGDIVTADFFLSCVDITASPRSIGFWKHQVGVALGGKGHAQIDGPALCSYLDLIEDHFNTNEINQVIVYVPPESNDCNDKLEVARDLLNLKGNVGMTARAKQQLTALLLNVAGEKLSLTELISADGATVSQAITYCDNLIDDPDGNHELAKTIADDINNSVQIAAGVIPLSTANIAYKQVPFTYSLAQNYPNPFNPSTEISFTLRNGSQVRLDIFNLLGQRIATLVDGYLSAGRHTIKWDGTEHSSGIYFYRLEAGVYSNTKKMLLLK